MQLGAYRVPAKNSRRTSTKDKRSDRVVELEREIAGEGDARRELAIRIRKLLEQRELTQVQAAALLNLRQPKLSALLKLKVEGFSLERLMAFLNALNRIVEISVSEAPAGRGRGWIVVKDK